MERVDNVLEHSMEQAVAVYWSSRPSPTPDSTDTLVFATNSVWNVVKRVSVTPFKEPDPFRHPRHVYTWKQTVVRLYRLPAELFAEEGGFQVAGKDTKDEQIQALIHQLIGSRDPVYQSQPYDVPPTYNSELQYEIPNGIVANVIVGTENIVYKRLRFRYLTSDNLSLFRS